MRRLVSLFVLCAASASATAHASFHQNRVVEVLLSRNSDTTIQYVEMQDISIEPFPTGSGPYTLNIYAANGTAVGSAITLDQAKLASHASASTPYLVATAAAATSFGVTADTTLSVTLPANGQACFQAGATIVHCLLWGTVTTPKASGLAVPNSTGSAPATGQSLQCSPAGATSCLVLSPSPGTTNVSQLPDGGPKPDAPPGTQPDAAGSGNNGGGGCSVAAASPARDGATVVILAAAGVSFFAWRRRRRAPARG